MLLPQVGFTAPKIIKFHQNSYDINNPVRQYYAKLLHVALTETIDEYGEFKLSPRVFTSSQQRSLKLLQETNYIDVHWTMTTPKREQELQAVYFPLLKGLMGYRVLLMKNELSEQVRNISTLEELKTLSFGQGIGWPDSAILKANNLNVTLANSDTLHKMLVKGRFDVFPRAVTEAWRELSYDESLTVDCCLLLQYVSPVYFFVNKNNQQLAKRLTKGLKIAHEKGIFNELFFKYRAPQAMFDLVQFEHRKRIYLKNIALSEETKSLLSQPSLWFFPQDINRFNEMPNKVKQVNTKPQLKEHKATTLGAPP